MDSTKTKELGALSENDNLRTTWRCCVCGAELPVYWTHRPSRGYVPSTIGMNNPWPLTSEPYGEDGETYCCGLCNGQYVIPARMCMNNTAALTELAARMADNECDPATIENVRNLAKTA